MSIKNMISEINCALDSDPSFFDGLDANELLSDLADTNEEVLETAQQLYHQIMNKRCNLS